MYTTKLLAIIIAVHLTVSTAMIDPCGRQKLFEKVDTLTSQSDRNLKVTTFFQQQKCEVRFGIST